MGRLGDILRRGAVGAAGALALAASASGSAAPVPAPPAAEPDLAAVSRRMARVDLGAAPAPAREARARVLAAPASGRGAAPPVERFLALYALPRDPETWQAFRVLSDAPGGAFWGSLGMSRVYVEWGTFDQAEAELERARSAAPRNWLARLVRAESRERSGRPAESRADYLDVLAADAENPAARLGMARLSRQQGDPEAAYLHASHSIDAIPDQTAAPLLLGRLALDMGEARAAIGWLGSASARAPRDPALRSALARARLLSGDPAAAVAEWQAALAVRETREDLRGLAVAARAARDLPVELPALERLVELDPRDGGAWSRIGALRLARGDEARAEAAFRRALDLAPGGDPPSRLGLGRILVARGRPLEALEQLRAAGEPAREDRERLERRLRVAETRYAEPRAIEWEVGGRVERVWRDEGGDRRRTGVIEVQVAVDDAGEAVEVAFVKDTLGDAWAAASAYWNLKDATYAKGKAGRHAFEFAVGPQGGGRPAGGAARAGARP
jgi:tetratricopeptide (TPR) repeat protein